MRGYVLGAALLAVGAWGYLQTKKLSDSGIEAFYQTDAETTGKHYTDASCALLADDFHGSSSGVINGMAVPQRTLGKPQAQWQGAPAGQRGPHQRNDRPPVTARSSAQA